VEPFEPNRVHYRAVNSRHETTVTLPHERLIERLYCRTETGKDMRRLDHTYMFGELG
jgi:hypothetical protein